MVLHRKHLL